MLQKYKQDLSYYQDIPYYYKDLMLGKFRNYLQPFWSTKYSATQITDDIFISDLASIYNKDKLQADGITHILTTVLGIEPPYYPEEFTYKYLPVRDISEEDLYKYFDECSEFIESSIEGGGKVLVHCAYGASRSASIVIAYLIQKYGYSFDDAYLMVKEKRPIVEPNNGFKKQLMVYSLEKEKTKNGGGKD